MTQLQVVRRCSRIQGMREPARFRLRRREFGRFRLRLRELGGSRLGWKEFGSSKLRRRELGDSRLGWRKLVGSRLGRSMAAPSMPHFHNSNMVRCDFRIHMTE